MAVLNDCPSPLPIHHRQYAKDPAPAAPLLRSPRPELPDVITSSITTASSPAQVALDELPQAVPLGSFRTEGILVNAVPQLAAAIA
jgi:hypothetical protein